MTPLPDVDARDLGHRFRRAGGRPQRPDDRRHSHAGRSDELFAQPQHGYRHLRRSDVKVKPDIAILSLGATADSASAADSQSMVAQRVTHLLQTAGGHVRPGVVRVR